MIFNYIEGHSFSSNGFWRQKLALVLSKSIWKRLIECNKGEYFNLNWTPRSNVIVDTKICILFGWLVLLCKTSWKKKSIIYCISILQYINTFFCVWISLHNKSLPLESSDFLDWQKCWYIIRNTPNDSDFYIIW